VRSRSAERSRSGGFTLLETLIALVIVGMAMAAIADVFGTGLITHHTSDTAQAALTIAENQIASAGAAQPLRTGKSEGIGAGGFHWVRTIAPFDDPAKNPAASFAEQPGALRLFHIAVDVDWRDGRRQRQIGLDTLRLVPVSP